MEITVIKSKDYVEKYPTPTSDSGFVFQNSQVSSMGQIASLFQKNFILNFPLKDSFIAKKTKEHLEPLYAQTTPYIILEFEKVKDIQQRTKIIKLFTSYKCVFFASRGCNDITNFDFRGVIQVDNFTRSDIRKTLAFIRDNLQRNGIYGVLNDTLTKPCQFTAPSNQFKVFRCEEIGAVITKRDIRDYHFSKSIKGYKPSIRYEVHKMFEELGFLPTGASNEDKVDFIHEPTMQRDYVWYMSSPFTLWHRNPINNVDIGATFRKRYKIGNFIEYNSVDVLSQPANDTTTVIRRVVNKAFLNLEDMGPGWAAWRDRKAVLCIRSAMGTGKTEMILKALAANPQTMVITPRVSLAAEMSKRSGGIMYDNGVPNKHGSIICQFDSLYKMDLRKYKSFIIDEYMTLESHVLNTASKSHSIENILRLAGILGNDNNQLMLMDALLSENVTDLFNDREIFWVENKYLDPSPVTIHKTFESFLKELSNTINRRITVSCVSRDKMKGLKEFLEGFGHKVETISSENDPSQREEILERFANNELSAIVYTPTLSVGINIQCEVDRHFHYDPGRVVSPIQSIQMMRRARLPEQVDCFIGNTKSPGCLSIDELRKMVLVDPNLNRFCFTNEYGEPQLTPSGKIYCWMKLHDNVWRYNSRDSFTYLVAMNFKVISSVEVVGSSEFKGVSLKSYKEKLEVWDVHSRRKIIEELGDHFSKVEKFISPEELNDFISYNNFRRSYESPVWKTIASNKASLSGDFSFPKMLETFSEIMDEFSKTPEINKKKFASIGTAEMRKFGLELSKGMFIDKIKRKENFDNLYREIWT